MSPSHRAELPSKLLCRRLFARWPLPQPKSEGDKEHRGAVLVIGGAPQMPGAVILAATAALRAGAGKLQIATCGSVARLVAAAMPEAYVLALREAKSGAVSASSVGDLAAHAERAQAVLIGPGMLGEETIARWLPRFVAAVSRTDATLILDAAPLGALAAKSHLLSALRGRSVITPHAGEMARITGLPKADVVRGAEAVARRMATSTGAVVALKGAITFVAAPDGRTFRNEAGNVGLATSGSGDTLSGVVAGLAARGADALQATAWGVHLHACAGDRLAARMRAPLGFLARELLAEIPPVMFDLMRRRTTSRS